MDQMRELMALPFPAKTKQAAGTVAGVLTDVMSVSFSDRILLVITQNGRLAQWVCVFYVIQCLFPRYVVLISTSFMSR